MSLNQHQAPNYDQIDNSWLTDQSVGNPSVRRCSFMSLIDTIETANDGEAFEIKDMDAVVDDLINDDNFAEAFRALLNPKTAERQARMFRVYALGSVAQRAVFEKFGEYPDGFEGNELEVAS